MTKNTNRGARERAIMTRIAAGRPPHRIITRPETVDYDDVERIQQQAREALLNAFSGDDANLIENHVKIYLDREVGGPWRMSRFNGRDEILDGCEGGDYTDYGYNSGQPFEVLSDLNQVALPTAEELLQQLAAALGYTLVKAG